MTRRELAALLGALPVLSAARALADPQPGRHGDDHPRLGKAIDNLEDAVNYLEHAHHNFGGHRDAALRACREALHHLRRAHEYRERRG